MAYSVSHHQLVKFGKLIQWFLFKELTDFEEMFSEIRKLIQSFLFKDLVDFVEMFSFTKLKMVEREIVLRFDKTGRGRISSMRTWLLLYKHTPQVQPHDFILAVYRTFNQFVDVLRVRVLFLSCRASTVDR